MKSGWYRCGAIWKRFNPNHDEKGRFTTADGGSAEVPLEGLDLVDETPLEGLELVDVAPPTSAPPSVDGYEDDQEANLKKRMAHMTDQTQKDWDSLTKSQKSAVVEYTGERYEAINSSLRSTHGDAAKLDAAVKPVIEELTKALDRAGLPQNQILHRGVGLDVFSSLLGQDVSMLRGDSKQDKAAMAKELSRRLAGGVIQNHGFTSTTISQSTVRQFGPVALRIAAPKGTKGMWVGTKERSENAHEAEFVLQRGMPFKIHGVEYDHDLKKYVVDVRV